MEYKVSLGANKFVGIHDRFSAGEQCSLVFESSEYNLDELHVTITDGASARRYVVKDAKFDISEYSKKAGALEIRVDLIAMGAVAKTWLLEPFVVLENGGGYEFIPEIALLRKEIQTMKEIIKELNNKIDDTM